MTLGVTSLDEMRYTGSVAFVMETRSYKILVGKPQVRDLVASVV
jgi:hypothetical protein